MNTIDVLLIGSGGREHALAWKLKQSPRLGKLYIAPGNPGMAPLGERVNIPASDEEALAAFAAKKKIGLTIVGPEDPLNQGIVNLFRTFGLRIFGPTREAARIETSKAFSKDLMAANHIPTANARMFADYDRAKTYVMNLPVPFVIKVDGLALGKGVYICNSTADGFKVLKNIMVELVHGSAGRKVIIEDYLLGREVSAHVLTDGKASAAFPLSEDHKQAFDGDQGPNTGGMGTYAPVSWITPEGLGRIQKNVIERTLTAMQQNRTPFTGLLYPGLMVDANGSPKVLEFNCRFGDPETQVLMRLLKNDLLDLFEACVDGTLGSHTLQWENKHAICVVLASGGYPGSYTKGFPITGLDALDDDDIVVFHAGTAIKDGQLVTNGGRVLGVTAIADSLEAARAKVYAIIERNIRFEGMHYRKDIGARPL